MRIEIENLVKPEVQHKTEGAKAVTQTSKQSPKIRNNGEDSESTKFTKYDS
jgi:hypothetical protein